MTKQTIWVLTREHNEYDQHGEYFTAAFVEKPSLQQLIDVAKEWAPHTTDMNELLKFWLSVLDGRGADSNVVLILKPYKLL